MLPAVFANENISGSEIWKCDISFRKGEKYLVEAASGAGKSSLCSYIFGARDDYRGTLLFNSEDIRRLSISDWQKIRRYNIAYLPQELDLFPELTALQNIEIKNRLTGFASTRMINSWLEELGIDSRRDYPAGRMSIGQQQRVAIIRSLCQPFDFILLDEPVSHLDEENNRMAATIIEREAARQGAAIISTSVGNPLLLSDATPLSL